MTNLLFVTTEDLTGKSGADVSTSEMVRVMASLDEIDLALIAPKPSRDLGLPSSVSTYWIRSKPAGKLRWHLGHQPSMIRALLSALWHERPDQVLSRVGPSMIFVPFARFWPGVEYRTLIRGYVHRNLSFQSIVKVVVLLNATLAERRYVSIRGVEEMLRKIGVRGDIVFVPNATDPERFKPLDEAPPPEIKPVINSADFVVGFVGSMKERHLVERLIQATASLPESIDTALVLVGDGPKRQSLEELTAKRGLSNSTVCTGHVGIEEVPRYIAACDVLFGISHREKPSNPIKVYEYLACAKPVITTRTRDLKFVNDKKLGVAMETNNVESIRDALLYLYKKGPEERAEMGRRAREHVLDNNTWTAYINAMVR